MRPFILRKKKRKRRGWGGGRFIYTTHQRVWRTRWLHLSRRSQTSQHSLAMCVCIYRLYIYIYLYVAPAAAPLPPMLYLNSFRVCVCVFRFYISNIYSLFPSFQLGSKTQRSSNVHITYCPPPSLWTIYSRPAQYIYTTSIPWTISSITLRIKSLEMYLYTNFALIIIQYYI